MSDRNRRYLSLALCLAIIVALTYLFLWRLWAANPADRLFLPEKSDLAEVFYPPRALFARELAAGRFLLWNPHIYAGYPQFADPQAATFYPPALLIAALAGAGYSMDTVALDIALHFLLVGIFGFLFFRHILGSDAGGLLAALVFEFGGYLTFYPPLQLSELEVVAWLPLTLLLIALALSRRRWWLIAAAGVSMGMVFLAGRPQSYLTIGPLVIAWLVWRGRQAGLGWRALALRFGVLSAFALGIAAAQWLPTLQLTRLSSRSQLAYDLVAEGGFPFAELTGFFVPALLGTQNLYVGLVTLLLAALALAYRRGLFWGGVLLVCLVGSVGDHLVLFDGLYLVQRLGFPGYLRNVERLALGMTFSLAALAGHGLLLLRAGLPGIRRQFAHAAGALALVALLIGWLWLNAGRPNDPGVTTLPVEALAYVGFVLLTATGALWLLRDRPRWALLALAALAVLDVMSVNHERFMVAEAFLPGNDIARAAAAPALPLPLYRTTFDQTSSQDFGSLVGADNVGGMPPLMLIDYERLRYLLDDYRRNILLNVGMVITNGLYSDPAYELVAEQDNFRYYRFTPFKPRAYLVEDIVRVADAAAAAEQLARPDFDYWDLALVQGAPPALPPRAPLAAGEEARVLGRSPNRLSLEVTAAQPRLLVVADTFYPGWRATVDGVPTPIYQTNVALRGIVVPAGTQRVEFVFRPWTVYVGGGLSLLTGAALLALVAAGVRGRVAADYTD